MTPPRRSANSRHSVCASCDRKPQRCEGGRFCLIDRFNSSDAARRRPLAVARGAHNLPSEPSSRAARTKASRVRSGLLKRGPHIRYLLASATDTWFIDQALPDKTPSLPSQSKRGTCMSTTLRTIIAATGLALLGAAATNTPNAAANPTAASVPPGAAGILIPGVMISN
jgi:hypothetical protein